MAPDSIIMIRQKASNGQKTNRIRVCASCENYFSEDIFRPKIGAREIDLRVLIVYNENTLPEPCSVCSLLAQLLQGHDRSLDSMLVPLTELQRIGKLRKLKNATQYAVWAVNMLGLNERRSAHDYSIEHYTMGLTVHLPWPLHKNDNEAKSMDYNSHRRRGLLMLADQRRLGKASSYGAREIDPAKTNLGDAKVWIKECLEHHPNCWSNYAEDLHLKVIDCRNGKIIPKPSYASYVTLSYVWGKQPSPTSNPERKPNQVNPKTIPRVVKDAMAVTRKLGYRYLWVDKFCINQQDEREKLQQIAVMDEIYQGGAITIVDAVGDHDGHGLAGAGTKPLVRREDQPSASFKNKRIVCTMSDVAYAVDGTPWSTRGWTYQEAILSTRCLIFAKSQTYFVCRTTSRSESIPKMPRLNEYPRTEITIKNLFEKGFLQEDLLQSHSPTQLQSFASVISMYLSRFLTNESDALNAFRGILSRSVFKSYWGVPLVSGKGNHLEISESTGTGISSDASNAIMHAFIRGLAWSTVGEWPRRRSGMPTWSWLSLQGGSVWFSQDPESKEFAEHFLLRTWDPVTKVFPLQSDTDHEMSVPFSKLWMDRMNNVLPAQTQLLMIEAMVINVIAAEVQHLDFLGPQNIKDFDVNLILQGNVSLIGSHPIHMDVDCYEVLPEPLPGMGRSSSIAVDWMVVRLNHRCVAPGHLLRQGVETKVTDFYLVVEPFNGYWKRVGCLNLGDEFHIENMVLGSFVLC